MIATGKTMIRSERAKSPRGISAFRSIVKGLAAKQFYASCINR
jgi:hypothetical protein